MKARKLFRILPLVILLTGFGIAADFPTRLQDDLIAYYRSNLPVKLHIFTNQPAYAAGDTIFFKATFLTAADAKLIGGREIVTIQLKDNSNRIVAEQKGLLNNGLGEGYLVVPDSAQEGICTLTAFNSWMKNQDPGFFFKRRLTISGSTTFSASPEIQFFPEGGKLIPDATNKLVVRGPAGTEARIFSNDEQVAEFTCNKAGLASFFIKPNGQDKLTYSTGMSEHKISLPVAIEQGLNIQLTKNDGTKSFRVVVQKSAQFDIDETVYLLVWNHAQILLKSELSFRKKENFATQFPTNNFTSGIHGITLFTPDGKVLAERLFYVNNSRTKGLRLEMNGGISSLREEIEAKLSLDDQLEGGEFAITVYDADLFPATFMYDNSSNNLEKWFEFSSDVADIDIPPLTTLSDIDLYLITQKWRRYKWPDVLQRKISNQHPFQSNLTFSGRAIFHNSGKPVPDTTRLVFLLQNSLASYETITDANGEFDFPLLTSFTGVETVYCQAYQGETPLSNVSIVPQDFLSTLASTNFVSSSEHDQYYQFIHQKEEIDQVYLSTTSLAIKQPEHIDPEILGIVRADATILLEDYLPFPTMRETIHEIIPFLKARSGTNGEFTRMYFSDLKLESDEDPVYIIDGRLTDDTKYFLALDPRDVVSVKLIHDSKKLIPFGLSKKGLVIVETNRPENLRTIPLTKSFFRSTGLSEKKSYPLRQRVTQHSRIPDLRACLYWNPRVKIIPGKSTSFSFRTPDNPGRFMIVIDGMTSSRQLVHFESELKVTFSK